MLRRLQRLAMARAFAAGNRRPWVILGASVWLLRKANEVRKPQTEVVYRGVLEPGHTMVVDHTLVDRRGKPAKIRRRR
ncbi:MAG: hypothetical protein JJE52_05540 [Acidimicrobiia bacterium]|nr:hypothetical protein [Acidimicrobiia bacterium]